MTLPPSFNVIEDADDMVARRIVMRRVVWDQLVHLAEALQETRELEVTPTDVAVIALEAGLAEVRKSSGKHARPAAEAKGKSQAVSRAQTAAELAASATKSRSQPASRSAAASRSQSASRSAAVSRSQSASRSAAVSRSQSASRSAAVSRSQSASRSLKRPVGLDLSADELAEVQALVGGVASSRGRQRTLALWLGGRKKRVALEALRELCVVHEAYNVANFAQNMKKDGALFEEVKDDSGERLGWRLTKQGAAEAKLLVEAALQTA